MTIKQTKTERNSGLHLDTKRLATFFSIQALQSSTKPSNVPQKAWR